MSVHAQVPVDDGTPPRIEVRNPAGSVTVQAVEGLDQVEAWVEPLDDAAEQLLDRVDVDVHEGIPGSPTTLRVTVPDRRLLRTAAFAVRITTPSGASARIAVASVDVELTGRFGDLEVPGASADLRATVASADVELRGRFADTTVAGASGDLALDEARELEVRTASGQVGVQTVRGMASIRSASGNVRMGRVGDLLRVRTASGDVSVEEAGRATTISTASGDVSVSAAAGEAVQVTTVSGDVSVDVVPGLRVWLELHSLSGRMTSDLDEDVSAAGDEHPDLTLTLQSVSGDLRIRRAAPAPTA